MSEKRTQRFRRDQFHTSAKQALKEISETYEISKGFGPFSVMDQYIHIRIGILGTPNVGTEEPNPTYPEIRQLIPMFP